MRKLFPLIAILFCFSAKAQIITTFAGNGIVGYSGDGGQATAAELDSIQEVAIDVSGNVYIADYANNRIRKVATNGVISIIAGNGTQGYFGDGGQATSAELSLPTGVAIDALGNVYIADYLNNRIRVVNTSGVITTFAGNGTGGYSGDGGQATSAALFSPTRLAIDNMDNVYISDYWNYRIRMVNTSGIITTFAGTGISGYSGDGGFATNAEINGSFGVAIGVSGNIYIVDEGNNCIRKVNSSGIIYTIAGNGTVGYSGDGGQATAAELNYPHGIAVDVSGNVYVVDDNNNRIRKVNTNGIISTIAGNGTLGYSGDGGAAIAAELSNPEGIAVDGAGNMYIADAGNSRIRKISCLSPLSITASKDTICAGLVDTLTATGATTYAWSTGAITATITPSPTVTTTYTVTGTGTNNCTNTDTIRITVHNLPNVGDTLISTHTPICNGDSIMLKGTGANTYTWTSITYTVTAADSIINGVKFTAMAGTDTFKVKGKDTLTGCINTATISVVVLPSPNINVSPASSATICPGMSTTFTASGAISYTWSPTTSMVFLNDSVVTVSPTVSTPYSVAGTGTNSCTSGAPAIVIIPRDSIFVKPDTICQTHSVTLTAVTASDIVSYTWSPATGLSGTSGSYVVANPMNTTVYNITSIDTFGCIGATTTTVTVKLLPAISVSVAPAITCSGQPVVLTASGASTYTWSNNGANGATTTVYPTIVTIYTVAGTDTNGCSNTTTSNLSVYPLPTVAINSGVTPVVLNLGQSITLNASGALTYSWTSANTSCITCASNTESPVVNTQYCVVGTDINGCMDSTCINVSVEKICGEVFVPAAFSPDGDGRNDEFKVYGNCLTDLTLQVFDRWGNQVYNGSGLSAAWDGTYGGSAMNTGTYIYQVQYTLSTGEKGKAKGNFILMR